MSNNEENTNNDPKHIAFILDGNRRWARERKLTSLQGHKAGFKKVQEMIGWHKKFNIKEVSLYCFSIQNFNRTEEEVGYLMNLFERMALETLEDKRIHEAKVKVRFIGRLHLLPPKVQEAAQKLMDATKDYDDYRLNFCVAYGGREEIVDGINRMIRDVQNGKVERIDEGSFRQYLYLDNDPEIVIRTSGEHRLSNFLTWHSTYSEWFFLDKYWPSFDEDDLTRIIKEYKEKRDRRFGGNSKK